MKNKTTYEDTGKTKWQFINKLDVECPKCSKKATIKTPNQDQAEPEIKCSNCFYSRKGYEISTYSNVQKIICNNCNEIYNLQTKDLPKTINKTNSRCPDCNSINQVDVEFDFHTVGGMYNRIGKDQYYGYDFWYLTSYGDNTFWAYNLEHLTEIEKYVLATERKRHPGQYQSMVEKLPKWVTSKKNRTQISKIINNLKSKTN